MQRYSAERLALVLLLLLLLVLVLVLVLVLSENLALQRQHKDLHVTPGGVEQMDLHCHFRKTG